MGRQSGWTARAREMRSLLKDLDGSGLSVREFARRQRIAESRIWYWRKRLRQLKDTDTGRPVRSSSKGPQSFVPVTILPDSHSDQTLEVQLASGHKLRIPAGFDGEELRQVLGMLAAC